jgi:uncharacterized FlgJ-related protein
VRPGEKLFEELNLNHECLIPTSHPKIKSFVSQFDVDVRQISACLQDFRHIVETQDVPALALLLKKMIPDYHPTSLLLSEALVTASSATGKTVRADSNIFTERTVETRLSPTALMN